MRKYVVVIALSLLAASCSNGRDGLVPQSSTSSVYGNDRVIRQKVNVAKPLAFTEFPLARRGPAVEFPAGAVAIDSAGTPWVLTPHAVVHVSLSGHTTSFPMPSNVSDLTGGITLGSDGALWFQGLVPDPRPGFLSIATVFRLTTSGSLSSYPVAPGMLNFLHDWLPQDITAGIDGKLWFSVTTTSGYYAEGFVGAITTSGVIGPFTSVFASHEITAGPDGNMWLALGGQADNQTAGSAARVSENGTIYAPYNFSPSTFPTGIATGPDGNLWVTLSGADTIVRMTTAFASMSFLVPTPNALGGPNWFVPQLARIVSGDKEMWFTEYGAKRIGRITMSGKITEYPIPAANVVPIGLAVSRPCGSNLIYVWFVESTPSNEPVKLARFTFKGNRAKCASR